MQFALAYLRSVSAKNTMLIVLYGYGVVFMGYHLVGGFGSNTLTVIAAISEAGLLVLLLGVLRRVRSTLPDTRD